MLGNNKRKELINIINLHRDWKRGEVFEDTKVVLENSSDERISYLLENANMTMKYEMIITIVNSFNKNRFKKLLLPYSEFISLIKEINRGNESNYEELYFMALEQIRTKYIPVSGILKDI
jgi:hypothetical protein